MPSKLPLLLLLLGACSTASFVESADREVGGILAARRAKLDDFRARKIVNPVREPERSAGDRPSEEDLSDVPRTVGLAESLLVATTRNRDYWAEKESLYLSALDLTAVRNDFSLFFAGTLSAILSDKSDTRRSHGNDFDVSVRQILPTGGAVTVSGSADADAGGSAGKSGYTLASGWSVDLTQPLLRDAGYETSHEALVQAERNVVYAVRDFELFREDFSIQVLTRYYGLVRQRREIRNAEKSLESRRALREESEAKYEVEMATIVDKLRAEREYLRAKNDLEELRAGYDLDLDRFKILLGLPTSFPLEIRVEEPSYHRQEIDLRLGVDAALHNRLDLITAKDRLEDARRDVRVRVNQLLPDLDLTVGYSRSAPASSFGRQAYEDQTYTLGLTLTLPFERTSERNALRRAIIDRDRAKRSLTLAEDNVILDVRRSHRRLRRAETSLEIREREIEAAEKEKEAAEIRFSEGRIDNRNVTDAENALLRARNGRVRDLLEYEVARIQLFRDMGILFVDESGMWVEP